MNKILKILTIISILLLLFCVVGVNAISDDFKVPDGFKKSDKSASNVVYYKDNEGYSIRLIGEGGANELSTYKNGFIKDNTTGIYSSGIEQGEAPEGDNIMGYASPVYGAYVEKDGQKYWVDSDFFKTAYGDKNTVDSELKFDKDRILENLNFFIKENGFKIVDI